MSKTFKEFREEIDQLSEIDFNLRKALGRRLKIIGKKASTQFKKAKNKLKAMTQDVSLKKGAKKAREVVMQKLVGKGKNLADLSPAQKEKLEKKADKKQQSMGGKWKAMVKKFAKKIRKAHNDKAADLKAKKNKEEV